MSDGSAPRRPRGPVAAGTHPAELHRLALQEASHPDCDPLTVQVLIWLFRAYSAVVTAQAEELRPLGWSPSGFNVLMALHNSESRMLEPYQLADRLLVSRPSVTGLLDTLQAKGLVARRPHPDDRRRVLVVLTAEGLALLDNHFAEHYRALNELFDELSHDERAQLVQLLRRIPGAMPADLRDAVVTA